MEKDYLLAQLRKKGYGERTSGKEVIQIYLNDAKKKGYTWFDTDSYVDENVAGQYRTMLFMVNGQIAYRAEILKVRSSRERQGCPPPDKAPKEWQDEEARTWIKIRNLTPEHSITVGKLKISSSGNALTEVPILQRCLSYVSLR